MEYHQNGNIHAVSKRISFNKDFSNYVISQTSFLDETLSYTPTTAQRLWHIVYDIKEIPKCQECGNEVKFKNFQKGYRKGCSVKCSNGKEAHKKYKKSMISIYGVDSPLKSEKIKEKTRQTNIKKYGVGCVLQSGEIKEKCKETMMSKYGVEHNSQIQSVKDSKVATCLENYGVLYPLQSKEIMDKLKEGNLKRYGFEYNSQAPEVKEQKIQTSLKNYGTEHPLQTKEVMDKLKATNLEKYGVENPFQSEEIKEKCKETKLEKYEDENYNNREKFNATSREKYGTDYPWQTEEIKKKIKQVCFDKYGTETPLALPEFQEKSKATNIERYGCEHPLQNDKLFEKAQKSGFRRKKYILPSGKVVYVQGYENVALDVLLQHYNEEDIAIGTQITQYTDKIYYKFKNKTLRYHPDLYIISINKIIEVKSTWTFSVDIEKNNAKKNECIVRGVDFQFMIFDKKKNLLDESYFQNKTK